MLLIASATTVAKNVVRGVNPGMSDAATASLSKIMVPGIVAGVGMVAAMSFAGATPETASTVDSLIDGLPPFLAQLNLGIVALVVNLIGMVAVSALTRGAAETPTGGRFARTTERQAEWSASR
jgi:hypothetical protein